MKIWITVATWNRAPISKICIEQLAKIKAHNELHISDDWSDQYNAFEIFEGLANQISKPPHKKGIQKLRCWEMRKFLHERTEDFIYLTDSDAFHDPEFLTRLEELWNFKELPITLYNAKVHSSSRNVQSYHPLFRAEIRKTMPGVSQFYHREHIKKIVSILDKVGDPLYAWDYRIPEYLGLPCVTSQVSYLEHFGGPGSLHNKTVDQDRAVNPTAYLKEMRPQIINEMQNI